MTQPSIALIYPPTNAVTVMPSLGIGYLAGAVRQAGFGVHLYDLARRHLRLRDLYRELADRRPEYVGLSITTPNYVNARRIAAMIRKLPYKPKVLLGGPHVSVYPEEAVSEFGGDYVVIREAEESLPNLMRALENGTDPAGVHGVHYGVNGHAVTTTPPQAPIDNLDEIPWPAWDLIQPQLYPPIPHQLFVRTLPVGPVITTRGCPFNCNFCASTFLFGKKIRRRSPADVVDEMEHLVRHYGIREIHIEDDNPTLVRKHIDALCEELRRRNWKTPWKFPNGIMVMTADADLLRMMKDAGCYQISLGIETANEETDLGKSVPVQKVFEITREARRIGLETVGLFVVGLPNETPAMMRKTIGQSLKMGLDFAHFGIYVPLPGSRWGREATETKRRFLGINFFSASQRTSKEAREVKWLQRRAVLSFYLRPRTLLKIAQVLKAKQLPGFLYTFRRYVFS